MPDGLSFGSGLNRETLYLFARGETGSRRPEVPDPSMLNVSGHETDSILGRYSGNDNGGPDRSTLLGVIIE
jgi:hypothetical protein